MKIITIETEEETGEKNITLLRADDLHPLYKEIRDSKQRVISTTEYTDNSIQFNNPNRDIHKKITLSGEFYEATSLDSILSAYPFENDGIISLILIYVNDDMVPFGDTVLYVPWYWNGHISSTWPLTALYVIRPDQDGQPVPFFDGRHPRDIAEADGLVYVLDAGGPREVWDQELPVPAGYTATIHASTNLIGWIPVATAHFTDTPNALGVLDGVAYIGTYGGDVYALPLRYYCTYLPLAARN